MFYYGGGGASSTINYAIRYASIALYYELVYEDGVYSRREPADFCTFELQKYQEVARSTRSTKVCLFPLESIS